MLVIDEGIDRVVKAVQFKNASSPMLVVPGGNENPESAVHPEKSRLLIEVSPFGKITEASDVQLENALIPMVVTVEGITKSVRLVQFWNASAPIPVMPEGKSMDASDEHPENMPTLMDENPVGNATADRSVQPSKVSSPT